MTKPHRGPKCWCAGSPPTEVRGPYLDTDGPVKVCARCWGDRGEKKGDGPTVMAERYDRGDGYE